MKKTTRPAENHPAIQNLRLFFKDFAEKGGSVKSFAQMLDIRERQMGSYLRGEHVPSEKTIRKWATFFGVDYETMMIFNFDPIFYPIQRYSKPRKGGRIITKHEYRERYDTMIEEVSLFVSESDVEYGGEIIEIIKRHKP